MKNSKVQSILRVGNNDELVRVYAKAIAKIIDRRGLVKKPYRRNLITGSITSRDGESRFSVWGLQLKFVRISVDLRSVENRTVQLFEFEQSPRRTIALSALLGTSEEITAKLWSEEIETSHLAESA